ncbi:hypothetical protein [Parafilimonas sp.]|uniref:hypothetical protein n=1 Tax=Parafilimonas sp. TaxID=1969739 RepID=UPI0039E47496
MKKVLAVLTILSLLFVQRTNAQIEKGNVMIGGDLADFSLGLNKNSHFTISLSPKAAWFIKDNIAVGAYGSLGLDVVKGSTSTTYGVGGLGRYYFGPRQVNTESVVKHTRFFGEANLGIEGQNIAEGSTTNGLGIGFGPGLAYFVTPNIGLETLLKYHGIVGFGNDPLNSRLSLNFGFQIYLPGKSTLNKIKSDVNK